MATSFNRNPLGSNQFILRTDEEIQAIIDSYPDNWTKKDFRGEGKLNKIKILTRKETERPGLKFKFEGKRKFKEPNLENIKRAKKIKIAQGGEISIRGGKEIGKNFSHIFPIIKSAPPGTKSTGVIDAKMNRALEGYNRVGQTIAEEQELLIKNKPEGYKKKILELNALAKKNSETAVKNLGKNFKGTIGYFKVNPDTGEFLKKGGNFKKTFAGIEGEDKIFRDMTGKERKTFEKKISNIEKLKTLPGITTASKIDRPEGALLRDEFKAFTAKLKNYDNLDPTSYPSKTYVRDELKKVPIESKINKIKDIDIPTSTILKGLGKGTIRAVAPFIPFVGAVGVALGVSDVAKAKDEGLEGEELGIAYFLGPELAKKYSDYKDRNLDVESVEEEGIMGLKNGGRVGFQGGGMDASTKSFDRSANPDRPGGPIGRDDSRDDKPTNISPPKNTVPLFDKFTVNIGKDQFFDVGVPKFIDFSLPTNYGLLNLRQRFSDFINPDDIDLNPELSFGGSTPLFGGNLNYGVGITKEGLMKDPGAFISFTKTFGGGENR
tara:strand:- start:706 stop:2352 length:1647 start_codon:yes stop_codon:yes gene_type:complete